jgi:hypothetical protein
MDEQVNIVEGGGNGVCWQLQVTVWGRWKREMLRQFMNTGGGQLTTAG